MKNKKGEAAIEFLKSYGWMAGALIFVFLFLVYFGLIDLGRILPAPCILRLEELKCTSVKVEPVKITLELENNFGKDIKIDSIAIGSCSSGFVDEIKKGTKNRFDIPACSNGKTGDDFNEDIIVEYTEKGSEKKIATGLIGTKVE